MESHHWGMWNQGQMDGKKDRQMDGKMDRQKNERTDICDCRVAFATENKPSPAILQVLLREK